MPARLSSKSRQTKSTENIQNFSEAVTSLLVCNNIVFWDYLCIDISSSKCIIFPCMGWSPHLSLLRLIWWNDENCCPSVVRRLNPSVNSCWQEGLRWRHLSGWNSWDLLVMLSFPTCGGDKISDTTDWRFNTSDYSIPTCEASKIHCLVRFSNIFHFQRIYPSSCSSQVLHSGNSGWWFFKVFNWCTYVLNILLW